MSRKCSICQHIERKAIDRLLIEGVSSYADISERFGTSKASLSRHKEHHIKEQTAKAINQVLSEYPTVQAAQQIRTGIQILEELDDLRGKVLEIYQEAIGETRDPPQPSDGPFEWSDVVALARRLAVSRKEALLSIREMSNMLGQYGEFLRLAIDLQVPQKPEETRLPPELEELLRKSGACP